MSEAPRRFDSLERTVRETRDGLKSLQATVMARLGNHTHDAATLELANLGNDGHEARYHQSGSAQSISDSIDSQVYLNSADYETDDVTQTVGSISVGSSFLINRAGLWHMAANVAIDNGGTANLMRRLLIADATAIVTRYAQAGHATTSTTVDHIMSCSTMVRLSSGVEVAMWVRQESTSARLLDITGSGVNFSLTWMRP